MFKDFQTRKKRLQKNNPLIKRMKLLFTTQSTFKLIA